METHPVLDVELAELAVGLQPAGGARDLLHEGAELHRLGHQGAAHRPEVGVSLGGKRQVVSEQKCLSTPLQLKLSRQEAFMAVGKDYFSSFQKIKIPSVKFSRKGSVLPRHSHGRARGCLHYYLHHRNDVIRAAESQSVITLAFY